MAAWIISALALLRGGALAAGAGSAIETVTGLDIPFVGPLFGGGGNGKTRRRRRKRALTASDRDDIAFVASFMSKAGVERIVALMVAN